MKKCKRCGALLEENVTICPHCGIENPVQPEKKKTAVGVRGMKLGAKDQVDQAYYLTSGVPSVISYHDKELDLQKMKTAKHY